MTKTLEELTEEWKAGKLKYGWYWVDNSKRGIVPDQYIPGYNWLVSAGSCIDKILAPCNYDEYKAMQEELDEFKRTVTSYVGKPIDYDIACEIVNKLLDDKEQLKKELEFARWYQTVQNEDIGKLRTLLKECMPLFFPYVKDMPLSRDKTLNLLTRINAALGESEVK